MKYTGIFITILLLLVVALSPVFKRFSFPLSKLSVTKSAPVSTNSPTHNISSGNVPAIPLSLPQGFTIHIFASGLGNPRSLQLTDGGTLLVSNPSSNEVIALPDKQHSGVAETGKVIISGENHVHGLAFYKGKIFIADVDRVVRYNWNENTLQATLDKVLFPLPENNDHNNRSLVFNSLGQMFISIGSTCNVCREDPTIGGSVFTSDENGNNLRVFATGLRNAAFLVINPATGALWGTEMGRDYLGDNTPPDEINIISEGKNYGWPNCYGDKIHDTNFDKSSTNPCIDTQAPIYQIPAHSAPLGIVFINSPQFPTDWQGDLLVAYHGSWNRSIATGYKVVHLKVSGNEIVSSSDFLTGFLQGTTNGSALGRPVGMAFDKEGNLYLSDDRAGNIYIIQKKM